MRVFLSEEVESLGSDVIKIQWQRVLRWKLLDVRRFGEGKSRKNWKGTTEFVNLGLIWSRGREWFQGRGAVRLHC